MSRDITNRVIYGIQAQMIRTVLVTGGGGFIGANIARELAARGIETHITLRPESHPWRLLTVDDSVKRHEVDFGDSSHVERLVKSISPDVVIHAACYGSYAWQDDGRQMIHINIQGSFALFEAARQARVGLVVNLGSSSEYGPKSKPMSETDVLEPDRLYGITKVAQTQLATHYRNLGLDVITLRLFSVYGPWEDSARLVPRLLQAAISGDRFRGSSPEIARDFVWIGDVVRLILDFDSLRRVSDVATINVGTGVQTSIGQLVSIAQNVCGQALDVTWNQDQRQAWDTDNWVADTRRMMNHFPEWKWTTVEEGIESSCQWLRTHSPTNTI